MVSPNTAKNLLRTFREVREKKSLLHRVREFRRFVEIEYETNDFVVKTAAHGPELLNVLKLRHDVFVEEWQGRKAFHGLDADDYDFQADHLMIIDKRINEIIGTYRLLSSHFTHDFYSRSEFHLSDFLRLPNVKLEMGRACIQAKYRDGNVIDLLWKGLGQYVAKTKTELLFGCTSVKSTNAREIGRLLRTLRDQGSWTDELSIRPKADYEFCVDMENSNPLNIAERRLLMPPLLRSYLHAGAVVQGLPALDLDFNCTDVLTILDWGKLNARFQSRFC